MNNLEDYPLLIFAVALISSWLAAHLGAFFRVRLRPLEEDERQDFSVVRASALTLLGLLVGFTFSMATGRYDQRKNYEEAEANAIGTEYVRADLLPRDDAAKVRALLKNYLDQRILFYTTLDGQQLRQIGTRTDQVQNDLWSAIQPHAAAQSTPVFALAVSGMNDVLNSEGYTQAAWWNRIPVAGWALVIAISIFCNALIGYGAHRTTTPLFMILPFAVAISLFLIADIDSPRGGLIRVHPQNLVRLYQNLHAN